MGRAVKREEAWRFTALLILMTLPLRLVCGVGHHCMAGHLQHDDMLLWGGLWDALWIVVAVYASVRASKLRMPYSQAIAILLVGNILSTFFDPLAPITMLIWVIGTFVCVRRVRKMPTRARPATF